MNINKTKAQKIVTIFDDMGKGVTVEDITAKCMVSGIWTKEEDDRFLMRARREEVRRALNKIREDDGLPEAQLIQGEISRDEDGEIEKVTYAYQRTFWNVETTRTWIRQRIAGIRDDARCVIAMARHAKKRWPRVNWSNEIKPISELED